MYLSFLSTVPEVRVRFHAGGQWLPDMKELAGGVDACQVAGEAPQRITWETTRQAAPEVGHGLQWFMAAGVSAYMRGWLASRHVAPCLVRRRYCPRYVFACSGEVADTSLSVLSRNCCAGTLAPICPKSNASLFAAANCLGRQRPS